jgi:hypothetical protein
MMCIKSNEIPPIHNQPELLQQENDEADECSVFRQSPRSRNTVASLPCLHKNEAFTITPLESTGISMLKLGKIISAVVLGLVMSLSLATAGILAHDLGYA